MMTNFAEDRRRDFLQTKFNFLCILFVLRENIVREYKKRMHKFSDIMFWTDRPILLKIVSFGLLCKPAFFYDNYVQNKTPVTTHP